MTNLKDLLKDIPKRDQSGEDSGAMDDPEYVRQSSKFISDALRKGQDVLQLDNGDIITTETKTVSTQYTWDEKKQKMVRAPARGRKSSKEE